MCVCVSFGLGLQVKGSVLRVWVPVFPIVGIDVSKSYNVQLRV